MSSIFHSSQNRVDPRLVPVGRVNQTKQNNEAQNPTKSSPPLQGPSDPKSLKKGLGHEMTLSFVDMHW